MKQKKIKLFRFLCEPSEHAAYKTDTDLNESKVIYSSPRRKRQRKSIEQDFKAHFVEIKMVEYVETMDIEDEKEEEDKADSTEKKYGLFIWPCSIVLSHFILQNPTLFKEKNILEIGCGTALPGITCAVHTVAKKVLLTDRPDAKEVEQNALENLRLNTSSSCCPVSYMPLAWGRVWTLEDPIDIILAADCFYQPQDFEKVLVTIASIIQVNPNCKCYTTYQLRSVSYSIVHLLAKFKLQAKCLLDPTLIDIEEEDKEEVKIQLWSYVDLNPKQRIALPSFSNIYLYEICSNE